MAMRRPARVFAFSSSSSRSFSSSSRLHTVPLAYARHDPPPNSPPHPPILLMHGLFGSQRNNRTMGKSLAHSLQRPVYNLDLRNHGDTPHSPVHTYTAMAEDVEALITSLSLPPSILIGHSMGSKVAMTLALRQPTKYAAIVPVDNAPVDAALKSNFGKYVKGMKEIEDHNPSIEKQSEADKILQKYESDMGIRQFLLTNFIKPPVSTTSSDQTTSPAKPEMHFRIPLHTLAKALPDMADFPFKDPDTHQFKGPVLIVRGTKSHYVADETLPVIGKFFPRFEVLDFECGHWVMSERFEGFRDGVGEWVRRAVDGDPGG